jgi:hypothetical protein
MQLDAFHSFEHIIAPQPKLHIQGLDTTDLIIIWDPFLIFANLFIYVLLLCVARVLQVLYQQLQ